MDTWFSRRTTSVLGAVALVAGTLAGGQLAVGAVLDRGALADAVPRTSLSPYSDGAFTVRAAAVDSRVDIAGAEDGSYVLGHTPAGSDVVLDLDLLSGDTARPWWVQPATGTTLELAQLASSGIARFPAPQGAGGSRDWVLVVDDVAAGYGAPDADAVARAVGERVRSAVARAGSGRVSGADGSGSDGAAGGPDPAGPSGGSGDGQGAGDAADGGGRGGTGSGADGAPDSAGPDSGSGGDGSDGAGSTDGDGGTGGGGGGDDGSGSGSPSGSGGSGHRSGGSAGDGPASGSEPEDRDFGGSGGDGDPPGGNGGSSDGDDSAEGGSGGSGGGSGGDSGGDEDRGDKGDKDDEEDEDRGNGSGGGDADAPAPAAPAPKPEKKKEPAPSSSAKAADGTWDELAQCESSGDWSISTGNGYHGGLQFDKGTWSDFGGTKYAPTADGASKEQQIEIATKVRDARGGYGSWPACANKLGLPR
ncbi:transglycosylase family protein [Pseudonocardia sp. ICBG162]|uniref:transglycosylase family protein n=1 Tax=Pseudonocardia sp. ICBG162 TaxID=2846761 RepID=UPI001CF6BED2|nr:transglycosylase family protein [Pseudonocardia sp. ICBG162]